MRLSHKLFMIVCLSSSALTLTPAAYADDLPPAVKAVFDSLAQQANVTPTYGSVTDADGKVTIKDLAIAKAADGDKPGMTIKIAEADFSDLSDEGDGLYQIGHASFTGWTGDISDKTMAFSYSMPSGSMDGWYVHDASAGATSSAFGNTMLAKKTSFGKLTVTAQGQTYSMDGYESTWDGDPKTGSGSFTGKLSNIAIPEQAIAMMDQGGMLKQLGYSSLSFDISGSGKTEIKDGLMNLTFDTTISGKDMGAFKLGLSTADVPMAALAEMQKAQKEGKQPDFNAMMPQLQNISFSALSLRFEDASITKKLLPMIAAMQGMDEKTMLASVGPMMQMGLMQLQNQAFAEQTSKAVNSFLADPKSITVSLKPAAPVKVSDVMTMNPAAPGEAITKLGVSVSAND